MSILAIFIQHGFGNPSHGSQRKKKKNPNCKDATRKLLELIKEFSKIAEYKINTQTSVAIVYTNNERTEIKETILFTIAPKIIKFHRDKPT